jgi:hypothetical protein
MVMAETQYRQSLFSIPDAARAASFRDGSRRLD